MNEILLANIRFYFAQSVFMNSCHYKAYYRLERRKNIISRIIMCFSTITIVLLILQVIGLEKDSKLLINIVAFVGLVLTGASLVFQLINKEDLSILMFQHKSNAEKYKILRDEYMTLIGEVMSNNIDEKILKEIRGKLQVRYSSLGEYSPATTYQDYSNAQKSLGLGGNSDEEFTWSNEEINKFLPKELRSKPE